MKEIILAQVDVNSESATIVKWFFKEKDFVAQGDIICEVETTKTVIEIEAEVEGYLNIIVPENHEVDFNNIIGYFFDDISEYDSVTKSKKEKPKQTEKKYSATKKALQFAQQYDFNLSLIEKDGIITEKDIREYLININKIEEKNVIIMSPGIIPQGNKKVLVIGAGFGAMQVIDILLHDSSVSLIGCVDDNINIQGNTIFNIPVIGTTKNIEQLFMKKVFTHAIISISTSNAIRETLFNNCCKIGIPFINAICPSVRINRNSIIGDGNIICSHVHIGVCTQIANNNFISSNSTIEHHNIIGSHNTWGPSFYTSGRVRIGNRIKFGMNVSIQPGISIGNDCLIASSTTIIKSIPSNHSIKLMNTQKIEEIKK